jgi:hypothetical protein
MAESTASNLGLKNGAIYQTAAGEVCPVNIDGYLFPFELKEI